MNAPLPLDPALLPVEATHGKITGKELFRVPGVDMVWVGSPDEARSVATRIIKAFKLPWPPVDHQGESHAS